MPLTHKPHIGVREIAASLGVGKTTVARALKGDPLISAATRARVAAEAARVGYVQPPELRAAMRALRRGRSSGHELAVYIHPLTRPGLSAALIEEITEAAGRLGYAVNWYQMLPEDMHRLRRIVRNRGCRGVLGCLVDALTLQALSDALGDEVPLVAWSSGPVSSAPVAQVGFRMASAARLAFHHARAAGHRRLGVVMRGGIFDPMGEFRGCWLGLLQAANLPVLPVHVGVGDDARFDGWLREQEPDCVVCFHPEAMRRARTGGERAWIYVRKHDVPVEMDCAGMDTRSVEQARQAVRLLAEACESSLDMRGDIHLVEPRWSPGGTLSATTSWPSLQAVAFGGGVTAGVAWEPLALGAAANQPFGGPSGGLTTPLRARLPQERVELAGIPFELRGDESHRRRSFVLLAAKGRVRGANGALSKRVKVKAGGVEADEVFLWHGCAYVRGAEVFAVYTARFADGSCERLEVRAPGRHGERVTAEAAARSQLHDWWGGAVVLESEDTKPVWLTAEGNVLAFEAHFYVHRWRLSRRARVVAIEAESVGASGTQLAVLAVTLARRTG